MLKRILKRFPLINREPSQHNNIDVDSLVNIDRVQMQSDVSKYVIHEFRNILTIISGYTEILLLKDEYKNNDEIQTISDMCQKGLNILNQCKSKDIADYGNDVSIISILENNINLFRIIRKNIVIEYCFQDTNRILPAKYVQRVCSHRPYPTRKSLD